MLLFLVTPCLIVAVQPCMKWTQLKKNSITKQYDIWCWFCIHGYKRSSCFCEVFHSKQSIRGTIHVFLIIVWSNVRIVKIVTHEHDFNVLVCDFSLQQAMESHHVWASVALLKNLQPGLVYKDQLTTRFWNQLIFSIVGKMKLSRFYQFFFPMRRLCSADLPQKCVMRLQKRFQVQVFTFLFHYQHLK